MSEKYNANKGPYEKEIPIQMIVSDMNTLIRLSHLSWRPSLHGYLYGSQFRDCIMSMCIVEVYMVIIY